MKKVLGFLAIFITGLMGRATGQERVWQPALGDTAASVWQKSELKGTCGTQDKDLAAFQSFIIQNCGATGLGGWVKVEAEQPNPQWGLQWAKIEGHGTCSQISANRSWIQDTLAMLCQGQPATSQTWLKLEVGQK